MTHIDTAEMYGNGEAEELVGARDRGPAARALVHRQQSVAVERHVRRGRPRLRAVAAAPWHGLPRLLPAALARRACARRDAARRSSGSWTTARSGRSASATSTSTTSKRRSAHAGRYPIACNQVLYNVDERGIEATACCRTAAARHRAGRLQSVRVAATFPPASPARTRAGGDRAARAERRRMASRSRSSFGSRGRLQFPKPRRVAHARENAAGGRESCSTSATSPRSTLRFPSPRGQARSRCYDANSRRASSRRRSLPVPAPFASAVPPTDAVAGDRFAGRDRARRRGDVALRRAYAARAASPAGAVGGRAQRSSASPCRSRRRAPRAKRRCAAAFRTTPGRPTITAFCGASCARSPPCSTRTPAQSDLRDRLRHRAARRARVRGARRASDGSASTRT